MRYGEGTRHVGRYLLALVFATLLALGAAVPVFAAEEPAGEDEVTFQPQIVGGEPVPDGKYKFVAALRDITLGNTVYQQQFCGGTLIDRDSVLTAAHCLETVTAPQLRVSVGITSLKEPRQGQSRRVERITRHPEYTTSALSFRYDAAVLTLARPVKNIAPAKIPATDHNGLETPGREATIAGWGSTVKQPSNSDPRYPVRMQEAQVPIVSEKVAKRAYGADDYVPDLMLAAGEENKDTCQGDSGGPIFVKKDNGRISQIGITSFGNGCGAKNFPGVYTEANSEGIRPFIYTAAEN
ncbi:MAG: serine protease [Actinomycetota bacterium]|nr:serine protease [Actinomycetota bacterium]